VDRVFICKQKNKSKILGGKKRKNFLWKLELFESSLDMKIILMIALIQEMQIKMLRIYFHQPGLKGVLLNK
jgi:hypothetical protein